MPCVFGMNWVAVLDATRGQRVNVSVFDIFDVQVGLTMFSCKDDRAEYAKFRSPGQSELGRRRRRHRRNRDLRHSDITVSDERRCRPYSPHGETLQHEVCVCAPCSHRDSFEWVSFMISRGAAWLVTVAVQRRGCYKSLIWILDAESTYLLGCGVYKLSLQSSGKGLVSSADVHDHRHFDLLATFDLAFLAPLPLEDLQDPVVRTCTLRKWYPRPACGTAVKSVRISISVSGFVPAQDEPVECLPWTRRTGLSMFPRFGNVGVRSGQQVA